MSKMSNESRSHRQRSSAHNRVTESGGTDSRRLQHLDFLAITCVGISGSHTILKPQGIEGGIIMGKQVSETLQEMLGILKEGRMTEGQETYFADSVVTQEGNQPPIVGKQASIERLNKFRETIGVAAFVSYAIGAVAVVGATSFYDAVLTLKLNNGEIISFEQVVKTEWRTARPSKSATTMANQA